MLALVRTQIQLTEEQARELRRRAAERQTSIAALIRDAVDQALAGAGRDARWERALAAVDAGTEGYAPDSARDASEQHDRYLADAYAGDLR